MMEKAGAAAPAFPVFFRLLQGADIIRPLQRRQASVAVKVVKKGHPLGGVPRQTVCALK